MPWCFSHKEVGEWKDLSHWALWKWAWLLFLFELDDLLFNPHLSLEHLVLIYINTHRTLGISVHGTSVLFLNCDHIDCRIIKIQSANLFLHQSSDYAVSESPLLRRFVIITFYLQLSTIFLHSKSDFPRYPGDKWGYYCLQAVHGTLGPEKKEYSFKGAYDLRMAWRHSQPFIWVLIVCGIVCSVSEGTLFYPRVKKIDNIYNMHKLMYTLAFFSNGSFCGKYSCS